MRKPGLVLSIWSWVLCAVLSQSLTEKDLYLNSYAHCGADNRDDKKVPYFNVDEHAVYHIQDEASPDVDTRAWRDCELLLRSSRSDGRLCLLQRQLKFTMCQVQLKLYDGWAGVDGVDRPNKTVDCNRGLKSVEWCTTGRYLTLGTKGSGPRPDVKHIDFKLLVYDMRSPHRKAYMDSLPYCSSTYLLDRSRVTVSNLDPYGEAKDIFPKCNLDFTYVGENANRSLCMVFYSNVKKNPACVMNYTLNVYEMKEDNSTGRVIRNSAAKQVHSCQSPSPVKWCASTNRIQLELHRAEVKPRGLEPQGVFTAIVVDHLGGVETLPQLHREEGGDAESMNASMIIVVSVSIAAVFCVALLVLVIFLVLRLRHRSAKGQPSSANHAMLQNGSANGHCQQNANEYGNML